MAAARTAVFSFVLTVVFANLAVGDVAANNETSVPPPPPPPASATSGRVELTQYIIAKPANIEIAYENGDIYPVLPEFTRQSQLPQPVVIRNYYLTAQAKQEVLPFWQDAKPLRLRNQFVK